MYFKESGKVGIQENYEKKRTKKNEIACGGISYAMEVAKKLRKKLFKDVEGVSKRSTMR